MRVEAAVHPEFKARVLAEIKNGRVKSGRIFAENRVAKWYIANLVANDIPVKVINLGGGAKKVILEKDLCPYCGGRGYKT